MDAFRLADPAKADLSGQGGLRKAQDAERVPLMGRDTEFSLLKSRWEQAQEGMGQVVLVIGEPGLGKSRLVQTLAHHVETERRIPVSGAPGEAGRASAGQDSAVIEWRCSEQFKNSELHPASDYLERLLEIDRDPSATGRFERLARHLDDLGLGQAELVALFAKMLLLPADERYSVTGLTPAREREESFRALRLWLRANSRKRCVLFVIEDVHWIDASSLEFLSQFIDEGPHEGILTILTFRPEF